MSTLRISSWLFILCFLIISVSCSSGKGGKDKAGQADSLQVIPVKTATVKPEMISRVVDFTASFIPFEEVHLAPSAPGRIEKIPVEIGSKVSKGQIVAMMDRTNLEQAKINLLKLETDFKRLDALKKSNSIADQQYDQVKSAYELAQNSYTFLLENTQLKSPFSGIVSGKYFEDGEIYSGSPVASVGKPAILSIIQINDLKALVNISSGYFPLVSAGMQAEVTSDIYPDQTFRGEIFKIYPTIDNATKTFTVEIKIPNTGLKLRPGMFAKIRLNFGKGNALMVPNIAMIKQTGTNDIYVFVNKNNVAVKTLVKTGRMIDDKIEVLDGLKEGDEIVVLGQNKLENQTPVVVRK